MLTTALRSRCGRAAGAGERCACCPQCGGRQSASALQIRFRVCCFSRGRTLLVEIGDDD